MTDITAQATVTGTGEVTSLPPLRASTGLDETRRLLYMALLRQRTEKYNLAATLINALAHHHPDGTSAEEIAEHVLGAIEDANPPDMAWVRSQVARITAELEAAP